LSVGDPVILHPQASCGFCRNCRAGNDMHCTGQAFFPGFDGTDGGYAEYLRTNARTIIKLAPGTDPASLAPFADAGITAYHAVKMLRRGGTYSQIGYGGTLTIPTVDLLLGEYSILGNIVGTYNDLAELMDLNHQGKVQITAQQYPLEDAADVLHELEAGRVEGRAVLLPSGVRQSRTEAVAAVAAR